MHRILTVRTWIPLFLLVITMNGCDERTSQVVREAADRQAQQNTAMAELNKEVAAGTHQLVEADAQARRGFVGVHHDLQEERARLDTGWNSLEDERRQIAGQRRTESILVSVTQLSGGVLLLVLLLGFCWYALVAARRRETTDVELNELLIAELVADERPVLPGSPTHLLGHHPSDRNFVG